MRARPCSESDTLCPWVSVTSCSRPSTPGPGSRGSTPPRPGPASDPRAPSRCCASRRPPCRRPRRTAAASPGAPTRCATSCGRRRSPRASGSTSPARSRPRRRPAPPAVSDSRVDGHNNAAGQAYGTEHAEDLAGLAPSEAMTLPGPRRPGHVGVRRAGLGPAALGPVSGASSRRTTSRSMARWASAVKSASTASRPRKPSSTTITHAVRSRAERSVRTCPAACARATQGSSPSEHPAVERQRGLDLRLPHHRPDRPDEPGQPWV